MSSLSASVFSILIFVLAWSHSLPRKHSCWWSQSSIIPHDRSSPVIECLASVSLSFHLWLDSSTLFLSVAACTEFALPSKYTHSHWTSGESNEFPPRKWGNLNKQISQTCHSYSVNFGSIRPERKERLSPPAWLQCSSQSPLFSPHSHSQSSPANEFLCENLRFSEVLFSGVNRRREKSFSPSLIHTQRASFLPFQYQAICLLNRDRDQLDLFRWTITGINREKNMNSLLAAAAQDTAFLPAVSSLKKTHTTRKDGLSFAFLKHSSQR